MPFTSTTSYFFLLIAELGAQSCQIPAPDLFHRPLEAGHGSIGAVIVGGEDRIIARSRQGICQRVRAVEEGISGVGVVVSAQGGFQVDHSVVRFADIGTDVLENGIKIVFSLSQVARRRESGVACKQVDMHQHIPLGGNRCSGYHVGLGRGGDVSDFCRGRSPGKAVLGILFSAAPAQQQRHGQSQNQQYRDDNNERGSSFAPGTSGGRWPSVWIRASGWFGPSGWIRPSVWLGAAGGFRTFDWFRASGWSSAASGGFKFSWHLRFSP